MKITNWKTGEIIHELESANSIKEVVEDAVGNGISLAYANLEDANLENADLRYANLGNANLYNANLYNAYLVNANLYNANLYNAYLINAYLWNATLRGANLVNANLLNANTEKANLENATFFNGIKTSKIIQISGLTYTIFITDNHIKIGCKCYAKVEWVNFSDEEISEIDVGFLGFWKENRTKILAFAKCLEE